MDRYHFPPMLGPASEHTVGSFKWAEGFGNELEYHVESVDHPVDHLAQTIRKVVAADPPPWSVFPPCRGSAELYFMQCTGLNLEQIAALLTMFGHTDLADVVRAL